MQWQKKKKNILRQKKRKQSEENTKKRKEKKQSEAEKTLLNIYSSVKRQRKYFKGPGAIASLRPQP